MGAIPARVGARDLDGHGVGNQASLLYETNVNAVTSMEFSLVVGVAISNYAAIVVYFPLQFTATNLGIIICQGWTKIGTTLTASSTAGNAVTWN